MAELNIRLVSHKSTASNEHAASESEWYQLQEILDFEYAYAKDDGTLGYLGDWECRTAMLDIFQQGFQMLLLRGCGLVQPGQHVSDVPARGRRVSRTAHWPQQHATLVAFQSARTEKTQTHCCCERVCVCVCYITVENSEVKLEWLRVWSWVVVMVLAVVVRGGEWEERGREEDSMFSELPMPPVKWRWFRVGHVSWF